jgi:glyoxylase-like metal-dependent hydrolase (beta-lactamase superfamily II)
MQPHTDFKFHPRITQIGCYWGQGGHTELYLLEGETLALIDTGVSDTPERYIAPALASIGRSLGDIGLILNTHGHMDHAGGNGQIVAAAGCPVWLPADDVAIAEDPDQQFALYFAPNEQLLGRVDRLEAARAEFRLQAGTPVRVSRALRDGDLVDLGRGLRLRVVHCPGHTLGSSSFFWEDEGILFSGDCALGMGSRPGGFPLIYFPDLYEQSLARLLTLDLRVLCLGHHYFSRTLTRESVKYGPAARQFLSESLAIAGLIRDAVASATLAQPEADFLTVARAALDRLEGVLSFRRDPETGLPVAGPTAALYSNWRRYRPASG